MIETPAAALTVGQIARHADFLSVGTNDLTQYTLVAGRDNATVSEYYEDTHASMLRCSPSSLGKLRESRSRSAARWRAERK